MKNTQIKSLYVQAQSEPFYTPFTDEWVNWSDFSLTRGNRIKFRTRQCSYWRLQR